MNDTKPGWAIYSDLSGVTELKGASFATRKEALENLVDRLEGQKQEVLEKLRSAKRKLAGERRRGTHHD